MRKAKATGTPKDSNATRRRQWNQENVKRVTDVLVESGYRSGALYSSAGTATIEFWIGPGSVQVIALQRYDDDMGFELLTPMTTSNEMDKVVEQLRSICTDQRNCGPCFREGNGVVFDCTVHPKETQHTQS